MCSYSPQEITFQSKRTLFQVIDCNWICIDIANGYISKLIEFCAKVREAFPNKIIIAGNVVTRELVEELEMTVKVHEFLGSSIHDYGTIKIELIGYENFHYYSLL